jgi:LAO/AO transport system kinase
MAYVPSLDLVPGVLAGEVRAIARLLTRAESGVEESRPALDAMFAHAGRAHIVGITGVPGSGKSTLVAKLAAAIRRSGRTVAIVAIDPSSPFTGGSILGDRIRMTDLAGDAGVYVRSMATHGALGGLSRGTLEAVDVLDAAGFDLVIIETVGVGQDEVEIARAAHTTVVVSPPGLGDDIQAIKAGILEIADVHVVSKCDKPEADKAVVHLKNMLALGVSLSSTAQRRVPIVPTSSQREQGIAELLSAIDAHWTSLLDTGEIAMRRLQINERRLLKAGEEILRDQFARNRDGKIATLVAELDARTLSPHRAAERLLANLHIGETQ